MTDVECIHGLPLDSCESCSPRQGPEPVRRAPVRTLPRQSLRSTPLVKASTAARAPKAAPASAVRTASRRYLALTHDEFSELIARGPIAETEAWQLEEGAPKTRDTVVIVSALGDADDVQFVAVPNEPIRRALGDVLQTTGRTLRIVVTPAWFL